MFTCIHCGVSVRWDSLPHYMQMRRHRLCAKCCRKYHREYKRTLRERDPTVTEKDNARARERYREKKALDLPGTEGHQSATTCTRVISSPRLWR